MTVFAIVTNDLQVAAATKHERRKAAVDGFLPQQIALLDGLRRLGVPVLHLQLCVPDDDARNDGLPDRLRFTRGSQGVQILPEVFASGDRIIEKPADSGFFRTDLDDALKQLDVDTLIVSGMQVQICVQTTAADAYFRGYKVIVPSDAVVSTREDDIARALHWLENYCATVLTCEQIIALVEEQARP